MCSEGVIDFMFPLMIKSTLDAVTFFFCLGQRELGKAIVIRSMNAQLRLWLEFES